MNWNKSLLIIAALIFCFLAGNISAQVSGVTYKVSAGGICGGGGASSSTGYSSTGVVPLVGSGLIASSSYSLISGSTGIIYGSMTTLLAVYEGNAVQVVTKVDQTLKVAFSGSVGTASGIFYYRQSGQTNYQTADMATGTGDTLTYTVPSSLLTIRGLEYFFEITRGTDMARVGAPNSPLIFRVSLTNAQAQKPSATPVNQYRIIGLPLTVSGSNSVASIFEDDLGAYNNSVWRIGRYDAGSNSVQEFSAADPVIPGRGYWLITAAAETFGAAGTSVRPNRLNIGGIDYLEVQLDNGWNQLANPFGFRIAWDEIRFEVNGTVEAGHQAATLEDFAYSWTGTGYTTYNAIPPWEGVFVNILLNNVVALMPFKETSTAVKLAPLKDGSVFSSYNWELELMLEAGEFFDRDNFIGVKPDALDGLDQYDYSEPPPAPGAPNLGLKIPNEKDKLRRTDYRSPITEGSSWDIAISEAPDRILKVNGLEYIPIGFEVWLVTDDGKKYDIIDNAEINLPDKVSSAKLFIGSGKYTQDAIASVLPDIFELEQNFPNPFNPKTTIRFALPKNNMTTLEIYNVLGQKVKTLIDEDLPAGFHTIVWDGSDSYGKESASGVYFYRLTSGDNSAYRKMLLVK